MCICFRYFGKTWARFDNFWNPHKMRSDPQKLLKIDYEDQKESVSIKLKCSLFSVTVTWSKHAIKKTRKFVSFTNKLFRKEPSKSR